MIKSASSSSSSSSSRILFFPFPPLLVLLEGLGGSTCRAASCAFGRIGSTHRGVGSEAFCSCSSLLLLLPRHFSLSIFCLENGVLTLFTYLENKVLRALLCFLPTATVERDMKVENPTPDREMGFCYFGKSFRVLKSFYHSRASSKLAAAYVSRTRRSLSRFVVGIFFIFIFIFYY